MRFHVPVRAHRLVSVRNGLKSAAEQVLLGSGAARAARARRRGDVLILAYHNIVPGGAVPDGDLSLHLPRRAFAAQLDALTATHEIIPLAAALDAAPAARPRAVITFDDAYRGAVTSGIAELVARGLPATIFVAPELLGDAVFWWDALTPVGAPGPPAAERAHALASLAGVGARVIAHAAESGRELRPMPSHARGASLDELAEAAAVRGVTLGSHSWSHPALPALDPAALDVELRKPLSWLREHFTNVVPWVAYPYGLVSPAVEQAARRAGYAAGLCIAGGWLCGASNRFALPRLDVPSGVSLTGFRVRAAGLRA